MFSLIINTIKLFKFENENQKTYYHSPNYLLYFNIIFNPNGQCTGNLRFCDSSGGKKYHYSKSCRGLSNCQHEIIKVTLEEAKKRGKTLCGWE